MTYLNTSLIRKSTLFLVAAMLSMSAIAIDFNQVQREANQGDALAQTGLGVMYSTGENVRQSYAKAAEWYEKSANQGDATAQFLLGALYYNGKGVRHDLSKAVQWIEKSANQGDVNAQIVLGTMYYEGEGVRQNEAIAKEWFGKACDNGDQEGCDNYRQLNLR